jgi:ACS family glucarate transporter-like MFS transporter
MMAAVMSPVSAQTYPERPVHLVVAFPPGGVGDIVAHVISDKLSVSLGQPVTVENRPGKTGAIGTRSVARAVPDGYTLLVGQTTEIIVNRVLFGDLGYDPDKDLRPVALITESPLGLAVLSSAPYATVNDVLDAARANPRGLLFGSGGPGTPGHLAGELLRYRTKARLTHVPFEGGGPALDGLLNGRVDFYFPVLITAMPRITVGQLKLVAVISQKRAPVLPNVPTLAEAGVKDINVSHWAGIFAPGATPPDIVARLNKVANEVLAQDEVRQQLGRNVLALLVWRVQGLRSGLIVHAFSIGFFWVGRRSMTVVADAAVTSVGRVRFSIVAMLFAITMVNYADRATIAIAGPALSKDLGLTAVQVSFVFSAFGWAYVIGQIPGGWLLDRFGSKAVYFASIFTWSLFTLLQAAVGLLAATAALYALFILRCLVGLAESPSFPANARIVAAWLPANERGTACAIFNSAQYFATVVFAPIMSWITTAMGWPYVFYFMGLLGIGVSLIWLVILYSPDRHPRIGSAELAYIERGGALVRMDGAVEEKRRRAIGGRDKDRTLQYLIQLIRNRMMLGIYLALTWFPVYLVQQRGMSILKAGLVASIPAICGFAGGVLGGVWSDFMLRTGWSLTAARKTPIVMGMMLSMSMVICNYVDAHWLVILVMALAFFGKGIGALGWAVLSDACPKEIAGLSGGLFNMFGNISSITTPIVIGYIIQYTDHSTALWYSSTQML